MWGLSIAGLGRGARNQPALSARVAVRSRHPAIREEFTSLTAGLAIYISFAAAPSMGVMWMGKWICNQRYDVGDLFARMKPRRSAVGPARGVVAR